MVTTEADAQFISVIDTLPQAALAVVEPTDIIINADITEPIREKLRFEVIVIEKSLSNHELEIRSLPISRVGSIEKQTVTSFK